MEICTFKNGALTIKAGNLNSTIKADDIQHYWNLLSHYPERRARIELEGLAARLQDFNAHLSALANKGGTLDTAAELERFTGTLLKVTRAYWQSEGRCASWFVVGAARFPTARNNKRMDISDRRSNEIREHLKRAKKAATRAAFPHGEPDGPVRGSNPDAPELLRQRIAARVMDQERMKGANKAIRSVKSGDEAEMVQAVSDAIGCSLAIAAAIVQPDFCGRRGFPSYATSNNNAEIKRLKDRLAVLEAKREKGGKETVHNTTAGRVEVVENVEADRIQLVFPGKPDAETRSMLKTNGFRWSPRAGAWQRHLNNAGRGAVQQVLSGLQRDAA